MTLKKLDGRVCVVTGANSGIGLETAKGLATLGAHVVMVCRSLERGQPAKEEVETASLHAIPSQPNPVALYEADLAVQADIRTLCQQLHDDYERIDVLINNAGVFLGSREETVDGIEKTFAVNHLAPFLLTHLLIDRIKATAARTGEARIVNVGSEAHRGTHIDFDDLNSDQRYNGLQAYGQSKLANVLFTHELARRLRTSGVLTNCVHPGVVATNIWRGTDWLSRVARLFMPFYKDPEEGARGPLYLAASAELDGVTGHYFKETDQANPSPASFDEKAAARLWRASRKATGLVKPEDVEERVLRGRGRGE